MKPILRAFFDATTRLPSVPRFGGMPMQWPLSNFDVWLDYQLDLAAYYAKMEVRIAAGEARAAVERILRAA